MQPEQLKPNDFQKFVLETAGYKLPLYGQSFFENVQANQRALQLQQSSMQPNAGANPAASGFAPIDNAPVSGDYLLGPGDQVVIRGWGSLDIDVRTRLPFRERSTCRISETQADNPRGLVDALDNRDLAEFLEDVVQGD